MTATEAKIQADHNAQHLTCPETATQTCGGRTQATYAASRLSGAAGPTGRLAAWAWTETQTRMRAQARRMGSGRRCREDGAVRREPCDGAGSASCGANTSSPGGGRLSDAASSSSPGGAKPSDADGDGASNLSVLGAGAEEALASRGVGAGEAAAGARRPPGRSRSSMLGGGGAERTEVFSSGSFRAARSACFSRCAECSRARTGLGWPGGSARKTPASLCLGSSARCAG
jgi:hypothetical protein